jgi:acetyl-CoA carboxylase carboxyltransferase component
MEIAERNRLPLVQLIESGGADLPTQSQIFIPGGVVREPATSCLDPVSASADVALCIDPHGPAAPLRTLVLL